MRETCATAGRGNGATSSSIFHFAVLLLGEPFTLFGGIGTALVLGGIGFHTGNELRSPAA